MVDVRFPIADVGGLLWYRAILPKVEPSEKLPVFYFLHGANSDPAQVMASSPITNLAIEERLIVVLPNAEFSYYTNARHKWHARWEDAITQELRRDVESRFPVLIGREHTGIAGLSMGGYGAIKLTLKHPEEYGFAGSMSGALDITEREPSWRRLQQTARLWRVFGTPAEFRHDEDVFELMHRSSSLQQVDWFVSCGEKDSLYPVNVRFAKRMEERGVPLHLRSTSGGHDWGTWDAVMPELFRAAGARLQ